MTILYGTSFFEEEVEEVEEAILFFARKERRGLSIANIIDRLNSDEIFLFKITPEHINRAILDLVAKNKIRFLSVDNDKTSLLPEMTERIIYFIKRSSTEEDPNFEMINDHFQDRQNVKLGLLQLILKDRVQVRI